MESSRPVAADAPFARTEMLLGADAMRRLAGARVVLFGLGGVGAAAAEARARCGVGHVALVDHDVAGVSNLNRQLGALRSTLGRPKTEILAGRMRDISAGIDVREIPLFYRPEAAEEIPWSECDLVLDAIDTVRAKVDLVLRARGLGIPVVSCMGMGNRLDPTKVRVGDLAETSVCPLCRAMRKKLRKAGTEHVRVVYSEETPVEVEPVWADDERTTAKRPTPGSAVFVPVAAGMALAAEGLRLFLARGSGSGDAPDMI